MDPTNKNSRNNQEPRGESHDLDRLSDLPDSILTHIFSFLESSSVIRTSVLSKRYKLLWTFSRSLDFRLAARKLPTSAFESYVNHVLRLRERSNLVNFRLSLHEIVELEFAQNCLNYAAEHKVQHLRIRGSFHKPLVLPQALLNLPSLVTLNLRDAKSESIQLPKSVSLPNLKDLCLKYFKFSENNYNGELFSGCPNLEKLVLHKCSIRPENDLKILDVSCLNLKHLEIKQWRSPWRCFDVHLINVNAPKLVFLKIQGHLVRMRFREVLACLERACFDLFFPTSCLVISRKRKEKTSEFFLSMFLDVCKVKVISLSLKTIQLVATIRDLHVHAPVTFENLRIIKITVENMSGEVAYPVEQIKRELKMATGDDMLSHYVKNNELGRLSYFYVKEFHQEVTAGYMNVNIPAHFMHFLLSSSPAAEVVILEVPDSS